MQIQERLIVPGLGVVILLSAFILGVPLVYKLLLGLLGLAAAGTYYAPQQVQVETRTAIAALGLIILLIVSSTAFWLTLLSFGAIAALQFQHRHMLQRNPATIAWLSTVLKDVQARRSGRTGGGGETQEAETATPAGDDENRLQAASPAATVPGFVRLNVAGIGSSLLGLVVLMSVLTLPWVGLLAQGWGEWDSLTLTLSETEEAFRQDLEHIGSLALALIALAVATVVSVVLPRIVVGLVAAAGLALNVATYYYIYQEVDGADLGMGIDALAIPSGGAILAAICCIVIIVFQLIPRFNRSRG